LKVRRMYSKNRRACCLAGGAWTASYLPELELGQTV
jgi:hypothetical protein